MLGEFFHRNHQEKSHVKLYERGFFIIIIILAKFAIFWKTSQKLPHLGSEFMEVAKAWIQYVKKCWIRHIIDFSLWGSLVNTLLSVDRSLVNTLLSVAKRLSLNLEFQCIGFRMLFYFIDFTKVAKFCFKKTFSPSVYKKMKKKKKPKMKILSAPSTPQSSIKLDTSTCKIFSSSWSLYFSDHWVAHSLTLS